MVMRESGALIAISAGGRNEELAIHGIGIEHVEELMVRMTMRLLGDGHRLAFGGTMGVAGNELTEHLINTALQWCDKNTAHEVDINQPTTWPLVNYSAWPTYLNISAEQRANLVGVCHFVDINPPSITRDELNKVQTPDRKKRLGSDALTAMRKHSALQTDLRVVWGGRIAGASGWMAGILEEVACSLEQNKPVLVLGGFGGCAQLIADFLATKDAHWPRQLSLAASADADRDASLTVQERDQLNQRMNHTKELLTEFRTTIHSEASVHGISSKLIQDAFHTKSARVAINIAASAAEGLTGQ